MVVGKSFSDNFKLEPFLCVEEPVLVWNVGELLIYVPIYVLQNQTSYISVKLSVISSSGKVKLFLEMVWCQFRNMIICSMTFVNSL